MRNLGWTALAIAAAGAAASSCGRSPGFGAPDGAAAGDACPVSPCNPFEGQDAASQPHACTNLCLKQVTCDGGATTSVSGTVYDPAGRVPLYNVAVYVPNAPLSAITHGATCDQCGSSLSGDPLVATLTDTSGHFELDDVPVATGVPLVIQIGKWRRSITIPSVAPCTDNPIVDPAQTRLPTKPGENSPDDDIPYVAVTTGGADALECLLPKMGIAADQFTAASGTGRVNLYQGYGGSQLVGGSPAAAGFWANIGVAGTNPLEAYDMILLGCEGDTHPESKPASAVERMEAYANAGGRVFATHYHYYWVVSDPAPSLWPTTAVFQFGPFPPDPLTVSIDQSFPKGKAFAQWMLNVGASPALGQFVEAQPRHDVVALNQQPSTDPVSVRWVYGDYTNNSNVVQYYSFNTPVGKPSDQQCGKVVFSDLHVAAGDTPGGTFPANCNDDALTPQEKALEFLLFDLSSCIQNDTVTPPPPK